MAKKIDFAPIDFEPEESTIAFEESPADYPGADAVGVNDGPTPAAKDAVKEKVPLSKKLEAVIQGFGQISTLGYLPQIQGAVAKKVDKYFGDDTDYVTARDQMLRRDKDLSESAPGAYTAGTVAGMIPQLAIPGGAAKTIAGKIGLGGLTGLATGLAMNPGDTEGVVDPLQMGERLDNAKTSAAISAALPVGGKILSTLGEKLGNMSKRSAYKALGPYARNILKDLPKGRVEEIGGELINEGVVGGIPKTYGQIVKKAKGAVKRTGEELDAYLEDLSKVTGEGTPGLVKSGTKIKTSIGVDRKAIAKSMRDDLLNSNTDIPGIPEKNAQVEKLIRQFEKGEDDIIPVLQAELKKRSAGKEINWDRLPGQDVPVPEQVQRSLYTKLKQGVEDTAAVMEKERGGPSVGKFKKLKTTHGAVKEADKIASGREAREMAKNFTFDAMAGMGMGAAGYLTTDNPEKKLENAILMSSLAAANRLRRNYGNQIGTNFWGNLGNITRGAGKVAEPISELAAKNPWAFSNAINMLKREKGLRNGEEK